MLAAQESGGEDGKLPTVAEASSGLDTERGFLTLHIDSQRGRVLLELPPPQGPRGLVLEMLYMEGLVQGLGSNPVGLDRGQISGTSLLHVRRLGERVLFERPNLAFRAQTENRAEQRATAESFATSVIWGHTIEALDEDGRSLVDLTPFVVRDAHGVENTLRATEQGDYSLDPERSAFDQAATLVFPDNVELESVLTFGLGQGEPGEHVASTAPVARAVTLVQHHSFIRLPPPGFKARKFDPRMASYAHSFLDYAAGLTEPLRKQWVVRHRLEKVNPNAERSKAREPIVYYVDRGAPEPVRTALVEGAEWWAQAFEAAGYEDAYRVELLPEGAHPLDVRYNVIQWVHRSTRGWSYGAAAVDPRTGEIVKGHVSLGSLRVRQDILLFEGFLGVEGSGNGGPEDPVQLALARIRQLSAHEVGHTLGFTHNFAASTYADRASVMDYPAPLIQLRGDEDLDFSQAYGVGIGAWDTHCVRWAYGEPAPGQSEASYLQGIVREGLDKGYLFLADADARPPGAADARGSLWDNGEDAAAALELSLEVRRRGLRRFGEHNIAQGKPLAELQEVLAPLYFHHRYQLDAAVKLIGGLQVSYAVRGDGQVASQPVPGEHQQRALSALLQVLDGEYLDLPDSVIQLLGPRPFGSGTNREMFGNRIAPGFDVLGAAASAADQVFQALLVPERLGRLIAQHRRDQSLPGPGQVLSATLDRVFAADAESPPARQAAIRRSVQRALVDRLMGSAVAEELDGSLRAWLEWALGDIVQRLERDAGGAAEVGRSATSVHREALSRDIQRFLQRKELPVQLAHPKDLPPGSPIGQPGGGGWGGSPQRTTPLSWHRGEGCSHH